MDAWHSDYILAHMMYNQFNRFVKIITHHQITDHKQVKMGNQLQQKLSMHKQSK